jgi:transposase
VEKLGRACRGEARESYLRITARERQALLEQYRKGVHTRVRLRAHILLLLAQGYSWATIAGVLFCSTRTIARCKTRVELEGISAVLGPAGPPAAGRGGWWSTIVAYGVTTLSPLDFGFLRSRWCCSAVVRLVVELYELQVSAETVRRWLQREQIVWRRPRPVVGPTAPERDGKLQALRQLWATLPANAIAVFQDEVAINTTPKLGAMWLRRGHRTKIPTPGTNENRSLAGSLHWRTGALLLTEGFPKQGRSAALFVRHLDDLRRQLLCYRKLHVFWDNARLHACRLVPRYLPRWGQRIVLHFLPTYAPDTNPIERIGWHLHEAIPHCPRCQAMEELLDLVFAWLQKRTRFTVEDAVYALPQAA